MIKTYDLYERKDLTIEQLREGYRAITGLNNDNELTDTEIYNYMLEVFAEWWRSNPSVMLAGRRSQPPIATDRKTKEKF